MKHLKKLFALVLSLLLCLSLLAACGDTGNGADDSGGGEDTPAIALTDMTGRTITLDAPATRVVALTAGDCEILYALGCGDALVGRGEYCNYPTQVLEVPAVQSGSETNMEQLLALQPQVIFMNTMDQSKETVEALERAGIQCVMSTAENVEGVYTAIRMIGTVMGKGTEAEALVSSMQNTFADLQSKTAGGEKKTVYFEVSPLQYGLWTAGTGTFMDEVATMLGLTNIFSDVEGWAAVSEEQVLLRDPDYIVTISMYFGEGPTPVEEILSRSGWKNVTAVKNGKILNLQNDELSRPAPRLAEGAQMMYDFVYGN